MSKTGVKRGRVKGSKYAVETTNLNIVCYPDEKKVIHQKAKEAGAKSVSQFIRSMFGFDLAPRKLPISK